MRYFTVLFAVILCSSMFAQTEGKIIYHEKIDIHASLPPDRAEFKEMIPQFRQNFHELTYNNIESVYTASDKKVEEDVDRESNGRRFRMRMSAPHRELYKNLEEDKMVDSREFMTKNFLIRGEANEQEWKIVDGQMLILDYPCLKATYQDEEDTYVAWFTPQIPISNGPGEHGGLPGMILMIDKNDSQTVITATEFVVEDVDFSILKEPTKGKEVTSEEFHEIMKKKREEMKAQHGGNGMIMIRHN